MSYAGYRRVFNDSDGRTRIVVKEAVQPESIKAWIKGKPSQVANTECPKCGRNTTAAISHVCP